MLENKDYNDDHLITSLEEEYYSQIAYRDLGMTKGLNDV